MSEREPDSATLARYLQGESDAAEMAAVRRWIEADPANAALVDALQMAFDRVTDDALWQGIAAHLDAVPSDTPSNTPSITPREQPALRERQLGRWSARDASPRFAWPALAVAAALIVAFITTRANSRVSTGQPFREFASTRGGRVTVTLKDGTQLVLGPATRLRVPNEFGFGSGPRRVTLDGEALFTVVHDEQHPFEVQTSRTTIRDVGTTFAVHAYAEDQSDRVTVAEGEVAIAGASLRARDMASVDGAGHVAIERNVDVAPYVEWAQGTLTFRRTPLRDAVKDVARTYDLDIQIADSTLSTELVTGSFAGQSADAVLGAMSYIVGAHFERNGRTIVIRRGIVPAEHKGTAPGTDVRLTQGAAGGQS